MALFAFPCQGLIPASLATPDSEAFLNLCKYGNIKWTLVYLVNTRRPVNYHSSYTFWINFLMIEVVSFGDLFEDVRFTFQYS